MRDRFSRPFASFTAIVTIMKYPRSISCFDRVSHSGDMKYANESSTSARLGGPFRGSPKQTAVLPNLMFTPQPDRAVSAVNAAESSIKRQAEQSSQFSSHSDVFIDRGKLISFAVRQPVGEGGSACSSPFQAAPPWALH